VINLKPKINKKSSKFQFPKLVKKEREKRNTKTRRRII